METLNFFLAQAAGELPTDTPGYFMLPPPASNHAGPVDNSFDLLVWVSLVFFAIIMIAMVHFAWKYRRKNPDERALGTTHHNLRLELAWTIVPSILLVAIYVMTYPSFAQLVTPPDDAYEVNVTARQFSWQFSYAGGLTSDILVVPKDKPVKLIMRSEDVIHSMFIPAFRVKQDVVPGRYSVLWFRAEMLGEFPLYCAEYCGWQHSTMNTKVQVLEDAAFQKWVNRTVLDLGKLTEQEWTAYRAGDNGPIRKRWPDMVVPSLVDHGRALFTSRGCVGCHNERGPKKIGPSLAGLSGSRRKLLGGKAVTADDAYLRASITDPNKDIAAGFTSPSPMAFVATQFKVQPKSDRDIEALVAFIKSLKK